MYYKFNCPKCNRTFFDVRAVLQRDTPTPCPECGTTADRLISFTGAVFKDTKYKDKVGERIWFPKDEKPYFDTALRRKFSSIKEKKEYMDKNDLVMDGSSDRTDKSKGKITI